MENLGVCADLTGGQVGMVDLQALSTKVGAMLANPIIGTGVASKGGACVATHVMGNATAKSTLTYGLELGSLARQGEDGVDTVPVQLQLRYTRPTGEQLLQVLTTHQTACASREKSEEDVNGTGVALYGIHAAARLAQQGEYRPARCQLISTCRLLQRAMRTPL